MNNNQPSPQDAVNAYLQSKGVKVTPMPTGITPNTMNVAPSPAQTPASPATPAPGITTSVSPAGQYTVNPFSNDTSTPNAYSGTPDPTIAQHPVLNALEDIPKQLVVKPMVRTGQAVGLVTAILMNKMGIINDDQLQKAYDATNQPVEVMGMHIDPASQDYGSTAKSMLEGATGDALKTAGYIAPAMFGVPGATSILGRVGTVAGEMASAGGAASAGQAMLDQDSAGEVTKAGLVGGVTSGLLGGAGQGASELAQYLSSSGAVGSILNKALGIPAKMIEQGRSPADFVLDNTSSLTKTGLRAEAQGIANNTGSQIDNILATDGKTVDPNDVLEAIRTKLATQYRNTLTGPEIDQMMSKLPLASLNEAADSGEDMSMEDLNALRKELNKNYLSSSKWMNNSPVENTIALKNAYGALADTIQGSNDALPDLFSKQSQAITTTNALSKVLSKPHIMTNLIQGLIAGGIGLGTGGSFVDKLKNAGVAFVGEKAADSSMIPAARGLNAAGNMMSGPLGDVLSTILKTSGVSAGVGAGKESNGN